MTNKTKRILIITGLIVCMITTILINTQARDRANESTYNVHSLTTRVLVNMGVEKIIQVTYKLLKST